jgi:tetratricopeptide (TPR) repeat protein
MATQSRKLHDLLDALPAPDSPEFLESRVAEMAKFGDSVAALEAIAFDVTEEEDIRFKAFQIAAHLHRRKSNFSALNRLLELGERPFSHYRLFRFYRTQYRDYDSKTRSFTDLVQDAFITEEYIRQFPEYIGFKAHFAGIAIRILQQKAEDSYAKKAENYLRECISLRPTYAHYHFLLGKLFGVSGNPSEALIEIRRAIDLEDSEAQLYYLRIQEYNSELIKVENISHQSLLMKQADDRIQEIGAASQRLRRDIEESGKRSIEFAGIFTLVISFLFLSIQSALVRPVGEALLIISFMASASTFLFSCIKLLFYSRGDREIAITMFACSLTLSAVMVAWINGK